MIPKHTTGTIKITAPVDIYRMGRETAITWKDATGRGATIDKAKDALTKVVEASLEYDTPEYRWAGSTLFVLFRSLDSWTYHVVRQGDNRPSSCVMGAIPKREALEMMMRHVAQEIDDQRRATSAAD